MNAQDVLVIMETSIIILDAQYKIVLFRSFLQKILGELCKPEY
jgi:hypothetical protein